MAGFSNTSIYLRDEQLALIRKAAKIRGARQTAFMRNELVRLAQRIIARAESETESAEKKSARKRAA